MNKYKMNHFHSLYFSFLSKTNVIEKCDCKMVAEKNLNNNEKQKICKKCGALKPDWKTGL